MHIFLIFVVRSQIFFFPNFLKVRMFWFCEGFFVCQLDSLQTYQAWLPRRERKRPRENGSRWVRATRKFSWHPAPRRPPRKSISIPWFCSILRIIIIGMSHSTVAVRKVDNFRGGLFGMNKVIVVWFFFLFTVFGALLGRQEGPKAEICFAFEILVAREAGRYVLNKEYWLEKEEQCELNGFRTDSWTCSHGRLIDWLIS